jgi:ABC-type uncharacterized transport system involved in gliding motility auxiliary subunit
MATKKHIVLGGMAGLALLLAIIGAADLILSNLRIRKDLTAERLYTLSNGSKAVLAKLDKDVTLKFYYSSSSAEMPMNLKTYAAQVQDLLKEYELSGKGKVTLEAYDPKPDSDAEEWAQNYGVEPQQVNPFGQPVYFGLVAVCGEKQQVLPGFNPQAEATLEYDITRLITRVAWPEKPVLGLMSSLQGLLGQPENPMMRRQQQNNGWAIFRELKKDYEIREVPTDTDSIDKDIKTLIIVHPKNLSEKTLFAIDQFVIRGGRLVACVDPFSVMDLLSNQQNQMMMQMGGPQSGPSTLGKLFDAWGVSFITDKVVADLSCSTKLNTRNGGAEDNPAFLSLTAKNMVKSDLLTSQLTQVMLPFCGSFTFSATNGLSFTPVMVSSQDNACLVDQMNAQMGISAMRPQLTPDGVERVLAARLSGAFKTAFPKGPAKAEGDTNATPAVVASGKSTVMLFGDSDFIADNFCAQTVNTLFGPMVQPINDNLSLFSNTIEQFAGREELIGVRSRGPSNRPFTKVDALEAKALKQWQSKEAELEAALQETQQKLETLQKQKSGSDRLILSKEQQDEIAQFRKTQADTRKQLKGVRKELTSEIDNLGITLKVINIVLVPLIVIAFGIIHGLRRRAGRA